MSYSRRELAADLRRLTARTPTNGTELKEWYAAAHEIERRLYEDPRVTVGVSEFIWHYLSDADVRMKEDWYAEDQNRIIEGIIRELES